MSAESTRSSYKWCYTVPRKRNILDYMKMFLPVFFAIVATMAVFFAIGWVNWWQALLFAALYLLPLFALFLVTAIIRPTVYTVGRDSVHINKGFEFYVLSYSKIASVTLREKRNSADVLFKLKKGYAFKCQLRGIEDRAAAREVYQFIKKKVEKTAARQSDCIELL